MGVAAHLGINLNEYDTVIRTLIPHYTDLIDEAAAAVGLVARQRPAVVDLGTGSGALAARVLKVRPGARLIGIDADAGILKMAERRLRGRIAIVEDNFEAARIPRCDVITASFALHHIRTGRRKAAMYRRCFAALRPGGALVIADCCLASTKPLQRAHRAGWLNHLKQTYTPQRAEAFLRAWAKEDVYFTLERERVLLNDAGFEVEVAWRKDCFAVLVALN
jgi:ubiquinone/menaquinone biosynthesis C-methylase UbiE